MKKTELLYVLKDIVPNYKIDKQKRVIELLDLIENDTNLSKDVEVLKSLFYVLTFSGAVLIRNSYFEIALNQYRKSEFLLEKAYNCGAISIREKNAFDVSTIFCLVETKKNMDAILTSERLVNDFFSNYTEMKVICDKENRLHPSNPGHFPFIILSFIDICRFVRTTCLSVGDYVRESKFKYFENILKIYLSYHFVLYHPSSKILRNLHYADRKSTRLNSSHIPLSRMPSSA